jgi:hypothetical protein
VWVAGSGDPATTRDFSKWQGKAIAALAFFFGATKKQKKSGDSSHGLEVSGMNEKGGPG